MARGKVKHIYDFSATVDWVIEMDDAESDITGSYQVEDISGDREYEFHTTTVNTSLAVTLILFLLTSFVGVS